MQRKSYPGWIQPHSKAKYGLDTRLSRILLLIALFILSSSSAQILDTGLLSPSANSSSGATNPANGYSSNNQYTVFDSNGENVRYRNFGISLPTGSTIFGIEVYLEGNRTNSRTMNVRLTWNNGSSFTSSVTMPNFGSSDATRVVGGPMDTWGRNWTVSELSNSNFGVRVQSGSGSGNINLDHVQVKVYYAAMAEIFTSNGTFTVPAGVSSVSVDAWGAGGGGASGSSAAGGGGGGAYTRGAFNSLTGGNSIAVTVGTGGNAGSNGGFSRATVGASNITANGGSAGSGRTGGNGGAASSISGLVTASYAGGKGGNARNAASGSENEAGGGGGGSAFMNAAGGNGSNGGSDDDDPTPGGIGTGNGGDGASGEGDPNATAGQAPGGGGGGRGEGSSSSKAGARGLVILSYDCPTYALTSTSATSSVCATSGTATVTLTGTASQLPVGTYTVRYNRSLPNASNLTASMTVTTAGTGSFNVTGLTTAGNATITITNLTSATCSSAISSGNVSNTITVTAGPTAAAGSNMTACNNGNPIAITAGASASSAASVMWSSSGTGTFANANSLTTATYLPSSADIAAGSVTLTLTAFGNGACSNATSNKTLTLSTPPTASAGGHQVICQNGTATVSGASAANGTISWTENGAGSITSGANTLTPTYTAAAGDAGKTVTLTMTVSNAACGSATATYTIDVLALPTANAGSDVATCANSGAVVIGTGASASNYSSVLWSSSGSGIFLDADSLNGAQYIPSSSDITAGSVILTLTAIGNGSCNNATSSKTLIINEVPVASGVEICQGGSGVLTVSQACRPGAEESTSFKDAGNAIASGSGTAWSNPTNARTNNNQNAAVSSNSNGSSQALVAFAFGFDIPENATIHGIRAAIGRYRSGIALFGDVQDNSVRLMKDGVAIGSNFASSSDWPTSETVANYGGTDNLWGTTWTPADINASNFGLALVVNFVNVFIGSRTANVDYMQISVTYSLPGDVRWYTVSSGGSPIGTGASFNPVGVAGSPLADTNTPGSTTFYAECSTVPGCRTAVDFVINALPEVSFSGLDAMYCQDASSVILTANHAGGTFSGTGVTSNGDGTGTFNPVAAGVGSHTIVYTFTDAKSCVNSTSQIVNVNANVTYYADADADGYGNPAVSVVSCTGAPAGYVADNTDCNDADATKHAEYPFYVDSDGDGFGTGSLVNICAVDAMTPPANYSLNNTDCTDADATKNAVFSFFVDTDGDGVGAGSSEMVCAVDANTPPAGYSSSDTDCNDNDAEMFMQYPFYADADGDGYGAGETMMLCATGLDAAPSGYSALDTDCDDTKSSVYPGAFEVGYNLIDDDCDGLVDEGYAPKISELGSVQCNVILESIDTPLNSTIAPGAQGYRWKVTTLSGPTAGQVQYLDTALRTMRLTQLANYAFGVTYKIEVAVYYAGYLQPYTPSSCTVTTPEPTSQLGNCGQTLLTMKDHVYAFIVPYATAYRFRITDPENPANIAIVDNTNRVFNMSLITTFEVKYNKTYNVEVAVRNTNGEYLPYGNMCTVTTPMFPSTSLSASQCDDGMGGAYEVPSMNTPIYAESYPGAIAYAFKLQGAGLPAGGAEVVKQLRTFKLSDFAGMGIIPGETYNVNIRLIFSLEDAQGPYGKTCSIKVPGAARTVKPDFAQNFDATAYPNPFGESYRINVISGNQSDISVKVYDMAGRLLDNLNVKPAVLDEMDLGSKYPAGVYNVIVSQGDETKSVRIIKR